MQGHAGVCQTEGTHFERNRLHFQLFLENVTFGQRRLSRFPLKSTSPCIYFHPEQS